MMTTFFYSIPFIGVALAGLVFNYTNLSIKDFCIFLAILCFFLITSFFSAYDGNSNYFQFVQGDHYSTDYDLFLGTDGISMYFVVLTAFIIPGAMLSNYISIDDRIVYFVGLVLLIEILLFLVFLVLDAILFYIFFESILPPLFIAIGLFGATNKIKAGFYLFLYTLLGSLFLLLAIVGMSSVINTGDYATLFKTNILFIVQQFLLGGAFIAVAVKTPVIFLNLWLLKAHVESPLSVSIILAAIVLKLSLYCIFRLILPILAKAFTHYTSIIFTVGVISVIFASFSTLRTIDVKELIAYSSVSHAAVYLLGAFSNCLQGIEGAICLGLGHGLVSPGLFICTGGVLYDRVHTRVMPFFRGLTHTMPLFSILFFILCLANCGAPLSLNFIGEFLSLYGVFERSWLFGALASSSIIFSAAYTMFMFQRISLGGSLSRMFKANLPDLNKREFILLLTLVIPTVFLGIYPAPILEGIHYSVSTLLHYFDLNVISCDAPNAWGLYFNDTTSYSTAFTIIFSIVFILLGIKYYPFIKNYLKKLLFFVNNIVISISLNRNEKYSFYLLATIIGQLLYHIYTFGDLALLSNIFIFYCADWADLTGYNNIAYAGPSEEGYVEHPKDHDGTVYRSNPEGERGTNGATTNGATTNGATTNGATTNGATTNGATTNGATTNGATTNGATTNGATTNGATTNGATTNGATTNGGNGWSYLSICPERSGQGHVWNSDSATISSQFRCHYDQAHPASRTTRYYFCTHCGAYSCSSCL